MANVSFDLTDITSVMTPDLVRKLDSVSLMHRGRYSGRMRGERRSTKWGQSIEFADYRDYSPGDDLRRVDWNLYARSDRLYVKLMEEEEDRTVRLVLDTSNSMGFGTPSKISMAAGLAASLGYVALNDLDNLVVVEPSTQGYTSSRRLRGRAGFRELLSMLASCRPSGKVNLERLLTRLASGLRRTELLVVISDLMEAGDVHRGLRRLRGRGSEVVLLHVLSRDEIEPQIADGQFELIDSETGEAISIRADNDALERYAQELQSWLNGIRDTCKAVGITYLQVISDQDIEQILFDDLRRLKVLE